MNRFIFTLVCVLTAIVAPSNGEAQALPACSDTLTGGSASGSLSHSIHRAGC